MFEIARRADSKLNCRFYGLHSLIDTANQLIDIFPPPVCDRKRTARRFVLRLIKPALRVLVIDLRIKIIVKMNSVDIVILNDLAHPVHNQLTHLRHGRIQIISPVLL